MATLQNSVQSSPAPNSFQEVYKSCYSHGLESIYKLETVDLKTIRKLSENIVPKIQAVPSCEFFEPAFDLGLFYQGWMTPFICDEPIQVLQLSKLIEKTLISFDCMTLGQIQKANLFTFRLGQGHIEEVQRKLKEYFFGKPLEKTASIDFLSLLKCLLADRPTTKLYVWLEAYGLHQWMLLSSAEMVEVKHLTPQGRKEWMRELQELMHMPSQQEKIYGFFSRIIEVWIKPWIFSRGGIATKEEIHEFLLLRSLEKSIAEKTLAFLSAYIDPFQSLECNGILAFSSEKAEDYKMVEKLALTYFPSCKSFMVLADLIFFLQNELIRDWRLFSYDFIQKALEISPLFCVYREKQSLMTRLNCISF